MSVYKKETGNLRLPQWPQLTQLWRDLLQELKILDTSSTETIFFSSPDLFDDLHTRAINCCGTVRPNRKGMPRDFGRKLRPKRGDLTSVVWKDKQNVNMLTNMHRSPAEGNFCDEHGNALKPDIVQDYNRHMGYVDKSDRMTNSYSIGRRTWKWTKKLFFHLLDLSVLNSYILLTSCGSKLTHRDFRLTLVRDLIQGGGGGALTTDHPTGQTNYCHQSTDTTWHSTHWTLALRRKTSSLPRMCRKK
jgi:hypothetical protein